MVYLGPVQRVPPDALLEYPGNPRRGDVPAIAESLRVHGQYKPVIVQEGTNHILVGNPTEKAAVSLGWDQIDAIFATVDDDQARKIMLADNRLSDLAPTPRMTWPQCWSPWTVTWPAPGTQRTTSPGSRENCRQGSRCSIPTRRPSRSWSPVPSAATSSRRDRLRGHPG
jgi:hypothetical protein